MIAPLRMIAAAIGAAAVVLTTSGCVAHAAPTPSASSTSPGASPRPTFADRGPQRQAEGDARPLDGGDVLYTVATGDTAGGIAARFGSTATRVSAGSRGGLELFAGDVLRFGPEPGDVVPVASTAPSARPDAVEAHLDEVVGTGRFTGAVTGTFTITQADGPVLHLRRFHVGRVPGRRVLLAVDTASAECRANDVGTIAGRVGAAATQDVPLVDSSPQRLSDLSYLHALALWPSDGCADPVRPTSAPIHWRLPAAIRDLARHDRGASEGASGTVQRRDGRPVRYAVRSGDSSRDVAARFGMTEDDLLYLNPLRRAGSTPAVLAGEELNLDPFDRAWFWR